MVKRMKSNRKYLIKQIILCLSLAAFLTAGVMPAGVCQAERRVKGEWVLPKHYPDGFHGYGYLYRIAEDEIIINDSVLKLAPYATYATPASEIAMSADFKRGDLVGYLKNANNEVESLWLIKRSVQ
jgi:hypothetical protein